MPTDFASSMKLIVSQARRMKLLGTDPAIALFFRGFMGFTRVSCSAVRLPEYYGGRPHGNRSNLPFDFIEFAEKFVLKNVDLPIKFVRTSGDSPLDSPTRLALSSGSDILIPCHEATSTAVAGG